MALIEVEAAAMNAISDETIPRRLASEPQWLFENCAKLDAKYCVDRKSVESCQEADALLSGQIGGIKFHFGLFGHETAAAFLTSITRATNNTRPLRLFPPVIAFGPQLPRPLVTSWPVATPLHDDRPCLSNIHQNDSGAVSVSV
ncbi:hypothetical protein CAPTEDRAFT_207364 [Capitella teleta]|uniref:Uncharacterized protein n=1 Tax=Capitella teleta TaxID=283909 RepID=R7UMT4_CAPTE|nr:hypothetical protein CAPTEDRAFT_207364 [Capitella teleta]|eukprot:ELU04567.1 hypothetical protein CAPTEDRAFT_207364 [Capitella teleta]